MKKNLIALLLALAMTLSLAACGGNESTEESTEETTTEETTPETEEGGEVETEEENVVTELPEVDPEADQPAASTEEETATTPSMPTVTPEVTPEVEQTPSAPAAGSVDLNAFYESLATSYGENWPFMMLAEGEMLDGFFPGLSGIATKQCYAYLPAMTAVAAEVVLVEVENAADVATVEGILQDRIDTQVSGGAWYPETIQGWAENSRIVANGNCVMMVVYTDADAVVSSFNSLFA